MYIQRWDDTFGILYPVEVIKSKSEKHYPVIKYSIFIKIQMILSAVSTVTSFRGHKVILVCTATQLALQSQMAELIIGLVHIIMICSL